MADELLDFLDDPVTRRTALRGLADFDHPLTVDEVLARYPKFSALERADAVQTLAARPMWARALMSAVENHQVPASDLSAYTARQLRNLGDAEIVARVRRVWGDVRPTQADKLAQIRRYRRRLQPDDLAKADLASGHAIFKRTCAKCHRLFGEGEQVGPDITGAQRTNLDYLLENLFDPSAAVSRDYQMDIIETASGRIITGLVIAQNENALTVTNVKRTHIHALGRDRIP